MRHNNKLSQLQSLGRFIYIALDNTITLCSIKKRKVPKDNINQPKLSKLITTNYLPHEGDDIILKASL